MMLPFITPSYFLKDANAACSRTVNMFLQSCESNGKTEWILRGTPGTKLFTSLSALVPVGSVCRGMHFSSLSTLWSVYGSKVIETTVDSGTGSISNTVRATITNLSNRVSITDNGRWIVIADGNQLIIINMITKEVLYPAIPFEKPLMVAYTTQRVFCITGDTGDTSTAGAVKQNCIWWSDLGLDGVKTWDALSYASAESSSDPIIALAKRQGDLVLLGPRSFELWSPQSNADLPITYMGGSSTEIGCVAANSVASISGTTFWVGSSTAGYGQVFKSETLGADRISNHSIEQILTANKDQLGSSVGFTYQQEGHIFYVLTIQQAGITLVYDHTNGTWCERNSRNPTTNELNAWSPLYCEFAFNRVLVGDGANPVILELDLDTYTDYPNIPIQRMHQGPQYHDDLRLVLHNEFQVDIQSGLGLQNGQGSDPQIMLQVSNDGGMTFGGEMWVSAGRIGQYMARARWRRLGLSRMRVYRITITDPVRVTIIGARGITETSVAP